MAMVFDIGGLTCYELRRAPA